MRARQKADFAFPSLQLMSYEQLVVASGGG